MAYTSTAEAYAAGRKCGIGWVHAHRPPGPTILLTYYSSNAAFKAKSILSRKCNEAWNRGFDDGQKIRNAVSKIRGTNETDLPD